MGQDSTERSIAVEEVCGRTCGADMAWLGRCRAKRLLRRGGGRGRMSHCRALCVVRRIG